MSDKVKLRARWDNVLQKVSNMVTSWGSTPSDLKYPSEKLVKDSLDTKSNVIDFYYDNLTDELVINTSTETDFEDLILKEDKSNKVSSWSNTPNDNHYPSEKLVKDYIDEKIGDILEYINS